MSYAGPANLPSRTGPVLLIVIGAIAMFTAPIVGVILGVTSILGNLDVSDFDNAQQIQNGGTTTELVGGEWMVVPDGASSGSYTCDVTGSAGTVPETGSVSGIFTFTASGTESYTINCDGSSDTVIVAPSQSMQGIIDGAPAAATSVMVGFLVAFLAFIAVIVGIVWLVNVNKRRREISGPYGGYNNGGYGGYNNGGYGGYNNGGYGQNSPGYGPQAGGGYGQNP